MEDYVRVIPRDLFNEAAILKAIGRLVILLGETYGHAATVAEDQVDRFDIVQDPSSGAITVRNITFTVHGVRHRLMRPLNSRTPWALLVDREDDPDFEEVEVFDEVGNFTPEMLALIGTAEDAPRAPVHAPPGYSAERDGARGFTFADEVVYPGFALGSVWNGFDNVEISLETRALVAADWAAIPDFDPETLSDLRALPARTNGRVSLAFGFATQLVDGPFVPDAQSVPDDAQVIVHAEDSSGRGDGRYTKPTLAQALDIFFGADRGPVFQDPDGDQVLVRADAEATFRREREVVFYGEDGDRVTIAADWSTR